MKKLIVGIVIASFSSSTCYGLSTGTLLLQGTVAANNNLTVVPVSSAATSLDIVNGNTSSILVATVNEVSNNLTGYKINIKSSNGGTLQNSSDATKKTTYTLAYDGGTAMTLTTSYQAAKNISSLSGYTSYNSNVNVNVAAYATAPAGTYQDTVTFQIVANP